MPAPPDEEAENMSPNKIRFYGTSKAYQARWDKVNDERTNLYADLLEAEAIWGDEPGNLFKVLFDLQHELLTRIRHYLDRINPDVDEARKEAIWKIDQGCRDIMYDDMSEEGDGFRSDFKSGIEGIEKLLKPKLTH